MDFEIALGKSKTLHQLYFLVERILRVLSVYVQQSSTHRLSKRMPPTQRGTYQTPVGLTPSTIGKGHSSMAEHVCFARRRFQVASSYNVKARGALLTRTFATGLRPVRLDAAGQDGSIAWVGIMPIPIG